MSILDMFRGTPTPAQQQQVQEGKQQQQQDQQQTTNGLPVKEANPLAKEQEVSGIDRFQDLWQTPAKKEGEQEATFDPNKLFDLDPAKLQEGLKGFDVTKGIKQEDLQAVLGGGEDAAAALLRILNTSNQATLQAAITAAGGMTQSAMGRAIPSLDGKIQQTVRTQQIGNKLNADSPLMKNEATKPILSALATQFAAKNPNATPEEVVGMVNDYMVSFGESMGLQKPGAGGQQEQQAAQVKDWSKFWND